MAFDWVRHLSEEGEKARRDPDYVPRYKIPLDRKRWEFWKPKWIEMIGLSTNQLRNIPTPPLRKPDEGRG